MLSDDSPAIPFELVAFHLCPKTCLIGDWHLSCTAGFQAWHTVTFIYTILLLSSPFFVAVTMLYSSVPTVARTASRCEIILLTGHGNFPGLF